MIRFTLRRDLQHLAIGKKIETPSRRPSPASFERLT
jgi:hypothetical protein